MNDPIKQELALMVLLWRDFKGQGKFDPAIVIQAIRFAKMFGIEKEYEKLQS